MPPGTKRWAASYANNPASLLLIGRQPRAQQAAVVRSAVAGRCPERRASDAVLLAIKKLRGLGMFTCRKRYRAWRSRSGQGHPSADQQHSANGRDHAESPLARDHQSVQRAGKEEGAGGEQVPGDRSHPRSTHDAQRQRVDKVVARRRLPRPHCARVDAVAQGVRPKRAQRYGDSPADARGANPLHAVKGQQRFGLFCYLHTRSLFNVGPPGGALLERSLLARQQGERATSNERRTGLRGRSSTRRRRRTVAGASGRWDGGSGASLSGDLRRKLNASY